MYIKPTIEVIEFKDEEVVMNLVASSGDFEPELGEPEVPPRYNPLPQPQPQPQPGGSDGLDNNAIV